MKGSRSGRLWDDVEGKAGRGVSLDSNDDEKLSTTSSRKLTVVKDEGEPDKTAAVVCAEVPAAKDELAELGERWTQREREEYE